MLKNKFTHRASLALGDPCKFFVFVFVFLKDNVESQCQDGLEFR